MTDRVHLRRLRFSLIQDTPVWLRTLLPISLLLINAALASMVSQRRLMLLPYLILGVGAVLIFLRWPPLGLIVALLAGAVVPFFGPSGLNITMILVSLLLGLWLLDMVVDRKSVV